MTQLTSTQFRALTASLFADNVTGDIGANDLRTQMDNLADSAAFKTTGRTANPTSNDDGANTSGNGAFKIGDIWVNETLDKAFICLSNSTGTAIWTDITFTETSVLTASGGPADNEIAVWSSPTNLESTNGSLTWNGTTMTVAGNIVVSGTVDGRDVFGDGSKLDGIPADAISSIGVTNTPIVGSPSGALVKALTVNTGDGLGVTLSTPNMTLFVDNNRVINDTANRTLSAADNNRIITNRGAASPVRLTLPLTASLGPTPRLVATIIKVSNAAAFQLIGEDGVIINNTAETAGDLATLRDIASVAFVSYAGVANTYFVHELNMIKTGSPGTNHVAVWENFGGGISGDNTFTWDGNILNVSGQIKGNVAFNTQTGVTYILELDDRGLVVTMNNGAANVLTIPDNATVAFPTGTIIRVIQKGAGATSITADTGVTLNGVVTGSGTITGQWDEVRLYKEDTNTWIVTGDIGAVA